MAAAEWIADLDRDGFVVVKDFYSPAEVEQARKEIVPLANPEHEGAFEYLINIFGKSPALDHMVERILTEPESKKLMEGMAGPYIKLRGYNVRRMTGKFDPSDNLNPAMDWHCDAPGEFCLAIFIELPLDAENAATAAIPGSHWLPYDPRWNCIFGSPFIYLNEQRKIYNGMKIFARLNPFSRLLARKVQKTATGIAGKPGDFYIFLNDLWHGRCPNLHGRRGMVVMIGGFPTDIPYPDKVPPPSADVIAKLPPILAAAAAQTNPALQGQSAILHRLAKFRASAKPGGLFWLAQLERRLAEACSRAYWRRRENPRPARTLSSPSWIYLPYRAARFGIYLPYRAARFVKHAIWPPIKVVHAVWARLPEPVKTLVRRLLGLPRARS